MNIFTVRCRSDCGTAHRIHRIPVSKLPAQSLPNISHRYARRKSGRGVAGLPGAPEGAAASQVTSNLVFSQCVPSPPSSPGWDPSAARTWDEAASPFASCHELRSWVLALPWYIIGALCPRVRGLCPVLFSWVSERERGAPWSAYSPPGRGVLTLGW